MSGETVPTHEEQRWLRSLLYPERPFAQQAQTVCARYEHASEAWEALFASGLLDASWLPSEERSFIFDPWFPECATAVTWDRYSCRERTCAVCTPEGRLARAVATPPAVSACMLLASDPVGMRTAEALAREFVELAAREGLSVPRGSRVVWRFADRRSVRIHPSLASVLGSRVWSNACADFVPPYWDDGYVQLLREMRLHEDNFEVLPPVLGVAMRAPATAAGPLVPLATLWMRGYALEAVSEDALFLAADIPDAPHRVGTPDELFKWFSAAPFSSYLHFLHRVRVPHSASVVRASALSIANELAMQCGAPGGFAWTEHSRERAMYDVRKHLGRTMAYRSPTLPETLVDAVSDALLDCCGASPVFLTPTGGDFDALTQRHTFGWAFVVVGATHAVLLAIYDED